MILGAWAQLECDLHARFGIDCESGVLLERSWRWFALRVAAILQDADSATRRRIDDVQNIDSEE